MRYSFVGLLMTAGVAGVIAYAAGDDDYYSTGVSRWEHATRGDLGAYVIVALVVASALALGCLARNVARTRRSLAPPLFLAVPLYLVSLGFAWLFLTGGH